MTDEERNLDKLRILMNAVNSLHEDEPDYYADLKDAAWNVLHENPGIDMDEWIDILMRQYPTEVVDAIGSHPAEAYCSLCELWEDEYTDRDTDVCKTFRKWAKRFSSYSAIDRYDKFAEQEAIFKHLQATRTSKPIKPQPRHKSPAEAK